KEMYFDYDMKEGKEARMRGIRTSDWKLIKHYGETNAEDELYDLHNDPGETRNLFSSPEQREVAGSLGRQLVEWQKKVNDPLLESEEFKALGAKKLRSANPGNGTASKRLEEREFGKLPDGQAVK